VSGIESAPRRAWARWAGLVRTVVGIGLAAVGFSVLNGGRGELVGASSDLSHLRFGWLACAIGAEFVSFVAFAAVQRRLLRTGGVPIGLGDATAISFAAGAIADSLPAGPAFAGVYAFRQYRRRGADDAVASWALIGTFAAQGLTLALVAAAGAVLAFQESTSYDLIGVILGVAALTALLWALVVQRRFLVNVAVGTIQLSRKLTHWPRRHGLEIVEEFLANLQAVEIRWPDIGSTLSASACNWLFDCGALTFSFLAVGAPVPWRALLLTYGAAQLAANLPITPGGLGIVEGTLTIALVAFGGAEQSTVAAVLCYRIVSFWGFLPLGWLSWAGVALLWRRRERVRHPIVAGGPARDAGTLPGPGRLEPSRVRTTGGER